MRISQNMKLKIQAKNLQTRRLLNKLCCHFSALWTILIVLTRIRHFTSLIRLDWNFCKLSGALCLSTKLNSAISLQLTCIVALLTKPLQEKCFDTSFSDLHDILDRSSVFCQVCLPFAGVQLKIVT